MKYSARNKTTWHFFIVKTDFESLASLCEEYQVDWLMKNIEEHLETVKIDDQRTRLRILRLSVDLNFKKAQLVIFKQIVDPFPWLQTYKEFSMLCRKNQIAIAFQRLIYLTKDILDKNSKDYLFGNHSGFLSIFAVY